MLRLGTKVRIRRGVDAQAEIVERVQVSYSRLGVRYEAFFGLQDSPAGRVAVGRHSGRNPFRLTWAMGSAGVRAGDP